MFCIDSRSWFFSHYPVTHSVGLLKSPLMLWHLPHHAPFHRVLCRQQTWIFSTGSRRLYH